MNVYPLDSGWQFPESTADLVPRRGDAHPVTNESTHDAIDELERLLMGRPLTDEESKEWNKIIQEPYG